MAVYESKIVAEFEPQFRACETLTAMLRGVAEQAARVPGAARAVSEDRALVALAAAGATLLVWAGIIESFVSQYHQPVLPYSLKIGFGCSELLALAGFLGWAGRR